MPPRHCVVIGAGVIGASVAAALASSGLRVTLLDQDQPGRATSRWSFAWLNSNDKAPRPYHDLNCAGIRAWAKLAPDLDGDAWYRPAGNVELAISDAGRAELADRVRRLTEWGYPARLIDAAEAAEIEPSLRLPVRGVTAAAWFPDEGYLLTEPLIARLVARAKSLGADVFTGEPGRVTGLDVGTDASPRVRTAVGAVLAADEVVCCAGRWTPELAAMAGATGPVPLVPWDTPGSIAPGLVVRVGPVAPSVPTRLVHTPEISLRPHSGRLLHLEASDAAEAVDLHTPDAELHRWAYEMLRRAQRTVRGLEEARVTEYQVCARPLPADGQSIVGRLPGAPRLYVAVTHSGVTLAAHLATLIAADLTTPVPPPALAPYRPVRFTPPRPGPAELAAARSRTIPDVLPAPGEPLRVLFCGINPSLYSAATGWHFARPGNRFWPALHLSGFTPRRLAPREQNLLPGYGLGITNLVARATAQAAELDAAELQAGGERLLALIQRSRPRILAIAGVTAYRTAFGHPRAVIGPQPGPLGGSRLWVLPNPSGLNAHTSVPLLAQELQKLRETLDETDLPRPGVGAS